MIQIVLKNNHMMKIKVDDYICEYYRKSRYMAVYKHVIYPVNGSNLWVRTEYPGV